MDVVVVLVIVVVMTEGVVVVVTVGVGVVTVPVLLGAATFRVQSTKAVELRKVKTLWSKR